MYAIILCGGSGSRLWPLSRNNYPKHFLKLTGNDHSLLQETFLRVSRTVPKDKIVFVTHKSQYWNVYNQIKEIYPEMDKERIVAEPMQRNTAPATVLGFMKAKEVLGVGDDDVAVVTPADHIIKNPEAFDAVLKRAVSAEKGHISLIGVDPVAPETGYGYVQKGDEQADGSFAVAAFKEKPDEHTARELVESRQWLWNTGMYVMSRATLHDELSLYAPNLSGLETGSDEEIAKVYESLTPASIDTAIAESSKKLLLYIENNMGWGDIGSFDSVRAIVNGAQSPATHVGVDSKNITVVSAHKRLFTTVGVDDLIIAENNDSTLICKAGEGEEVKTLVEKLAAEGYKEVADEIIEHRPWGSFEILIDEDTYKVKRLTVLPGHKLSLQSHKRRSEHWVVVTGTATVVNGEKKYDVPQNESVYIPVGNKHQLGNNTDSLVEIIEVQTGDYFGEDDIFRYEDDYAREAEPKKSGE